jgi:hypothetical protein
LILGQKIHYFVLLSKLFSIVRVNQIQFFQGEIEHETISVRVHGVKKKRPFSLFKDLGNGLSFSTT